MALGDLLKTAFKGGFGTPISVALLAGGSYLAIHDDITKLQLQQQSYEKSTSERLSDLSQKFDRMDLWLRPPPVKQTIIKRDATARIQQVSLNTKQYEQQAILQK